MRLFGLTVLAIVLIAVAAVIQVTLAPRISFFGAYPQFALLIAFTLSLLIRQVGGAFVGFWSGLLAGVMSGSSVTLYVVIRAIACFGLSSFVELEPSNKTAALTIAGATLASQLVLMIVAPTPDIGEYVRVAILQSVLNGILAWPLYAGLRKVYRPKVV